MKFLRIIFVCAVFSFPLFGAEKMNVLVEPFVNNGTNDYSWIASGMTETCIADLSRFKGIRVISENERRKALEEISLLQTGVLASDEGVKVGDFLGAHIIFSGSYTVVSGKIRVLARLTNVKTGETEKSVKLDGDVKEIFSVQDDIIVSLLRETEKLDIKGVQKIRVTEKDVQRIESKPKPDLSAYEYYCRGLDSMDSNPRAALEFFKKAISIQSDYADAYKLAGYVSSGILYDTAQGLDLLMESDRLYQMRNETDTANYADLLTLIGGNYYNRFVYDEALNYYGKSIGIYSNLGMANSHGYANVIYGMGAAIEGQAAKLQADGKENESQAKHKEAMKYYNQADGIFKSLKMTGSTSYGHLMYGIAYVYGQMKKYDDALRYYLRAKDIYDKNAMGSNPIFGNLLYNIAWVYDNKGNYKEAVFYYDEAYDCYERADYTGSEKSYVKSRADELRPYVK